MSSARTSPSRPPDGRQLAETRERFLTAEPFEADAVRDTILASWWRSRRWNVAADHIDLSYVRDPNLDTPLTRSAMPVLRHLRDHLDGQPVSIILTDAAGVVLTRLMADQQLDRHLDGVHLAPGFSYAEASVGTNGIGTALEGGRPMHVFGHEHYAENLEDLACAGVPIHHPISGKTLGAVDLTCWRKDAGPLLITLAKTTADQIRQALLTDSGVREYALLQEYLRTCRHTAGIVFAFNNDVVMMNDDARQVLDAADQAVLLGHASEAMAMRRAATVPLELPSGMTARMYCRPVLAEDGPAGCVAHVKLLQRGTPMSRAAQPPPRALLPGLVGSGPMWLRACQQAEAVYVSGEWLALAGEAGVGKLALVRAVHSKHDPAGRLHVLDAADPGPQWAHVAMQDLRERSGSLVIRHVDRLDAERLQLVCDALASALLTGRQHALWVAVTLDGPPRDDNDLARLLRFFPRTVELPPLRHHIEDLHELVPLLLRKLSGDRRLSCSPEAMQLLLRCGWPGNTEQLWQVLRRVVQHRRTGVVAPDDLPPECRTVSRRLLSPLESMERDAIVQSLLDCGGNKARAAQALGMSRATIYRKIHEYGIVTPATVPPASPR